MVASIDIDRERAHWLPRYPGLPRARAMRSFARYWPVLCAAYDAWLNQPHAGYEERLAAFLLRHLVPTGPVTLVADDTVDGHKGERVYG